MDQEKPMTPSSLIVDLQKTMATEAIIIKNYA